MRKLGAASRATFISPYLRRPLRPLDKVLSEREVRPADDTADALGEPRADTAAPATWSMSRKAAASE